MSVLRLGDYLECMLEARRIGGCLKLQRLVAVIEGFVVRQVERISFMAQADLFFVARRYLIGSCLRSI